MLKSILVILEANMLEMKIKILKSCLGALLVLLFFVGCEISPPPPPPPPVSSVSIVERPTHYEITVNMIGTSQQNMGRDYINEVRKILPQFEAIVDGYLSDSGVDNSIISRMASIRPKIPASYREELDGMASQLSGGTTNSIGDGKLSRDELYATNLVPDILRGSQCSTISVFGSASDTGHTMTARALDWPTGSTNQLAKLHAVTKIVNGAKSITTVGFLGFVGIISAYNDSGIFSAILDSGTNQPYSANNKSSYVFDLRYALENLSTIDEIGAFMTDSTRSYAFSHNIVLSDETQTKIVENDLTSSANRRLRSYNSTLHAPVSWSPTNAIASVNSFLLSGSYDNHTADTTNTARWTSYQTLTASAGPVYTLAELQEVITYYSGSTPGSMSSGDIYNDLTCQIMLFEPFTKSLKVYFLPKSGVRVSTPVFETIAF
ncbi:MAG: hypothetical protein H7Y09_02380 [Chitinophagaceae bacterium]|nr:hypothetical protein [Anaerolineae bacterium]